MYQIDSSTRNIIFLGISFFSVGIALNTAAFIIEPAVEASSNSTGINPHAGYYCMSVMYATYTVSTIVATPLVDILQPKWALFLAAVGYSIFYGSIMWVNEMLLYLDGVILGACSALLWTGQGTYVAQNSNVKTVDRNSSIVLVFGQTALIFGGAFMYILISNSSHDNLFASEQSKILFTTFGACSFLSAILFAFMPTSKEAECKKKGYITILGDMFKLFTTPNMLLLCVSFAYNGLQIGFWMIVYPTAITFTKTLVRDTKTVIALVSMSTGVGEVVAALAFTFLGARIQKIGRLSMFYTGMAIHLVCFALIFLSLPSEATLRPTHSTDTYITPTMPLVVFIAFLLGVADIFWYQQTMAFVCDAYPHQETPAFALSRFLQAGMSGTVMFYSSKITLDYQMMIAASLSLTACITFGVLQRNIRTQTGYKSIFFGDLRPQGIAPSLVADCKNVSQDSFKPLEESY